MELKNNGKINFVIDLFLNLDEYISGGLIALHKLSYELAKRGHNVYIFCKPNYPHENIHIIPSKFEVIYLHNISCSWELFSYNLNNTVSIYPEHTIGNKFNTKNNAKWIMYHTKEEEDDAINESDYIFNYGNFITRTKREDGKLTVLDYNLDKFYVKEKNRTGHCFMKLKNTPKNYESLLSVFDYTDVSYLHKITDLNIVCDEFNKYEYFLTFDEKTYLTTAAALCGCKSIIIKQEDKLTPTEYRIQNPTNMFGVAYGIEDIKWAEDTIHLVRDHIIELEKIDNKTIDKFVDFWNKKCYG